MDHLCERPGTSFRRPAVLVVLLLLAVLLPLPTAGAADGDTQAEPLTVRLDRMSQATVPATGKIVLEGNVTNDSDQVWRAVNLHPFMSYSPMTTRDELAAAAASEATADVGKRLTKIGEFEAVGDLQPEQSAAFRIVLPAKDLPISHQAGVYWIGIHALAQSPDGKRGVEGRDRTFIPLVKGTAARASVALVLPVREPVRRDTRGRVLDATDWSDDLASTGRLGRLAGLVSSAGPTPLTLLIDPAVLDAVSDLGDANPPLSLGTALVPGPSSSASPTASPSRSGTREETGDQAGDQAGLQADAKTWLSEITAAAHRHATLGLGYADPDIAALIRQGSPLYALSNRLSAETFKALHIPAVPAVAPPTGWLEDDAIARLKQQTTVLVSDHAAPRTRSRWVAPGGQDLVFSDQQASSGGPGPTPALDALALRQRIVSEAALRAAEHADGPMVVELPPGWDPGPGWQSAGFFAGLEQPWLDLVELGPNTDPSTPTFSGLLGYPPAQQKLEISKPNVTAARVLAQTTTALSQLLRTTNDVDHELAGIALTAVSLHARPDEVEARVQVIDTNTAIRDRMGKVEVLGTDFVTLSGGSGTLAVTLVNGLEQPVTVGVEPHTSSGNVTIAASRPVTMAPGERTVLRLRAKASSIGVSRIELTPVTSEGTQLGTPLVFSLRTSQVGKTIWFVLIGFGALLVVMILRRVRRGLVEHRWKGRG